MKSAIYIENGTVQVVLTPERDFEKCIVRMLEGSLSATAYRASFYECRGGYHRQGTSDDSLIVRIDRETSTA